MILPIENAIRDMEGIEEINSTASSGSANIKVLLLSGYDPNVLLQKIEQEVSRVTTLPAESERPQLVLTNRKQDVMELVIHGDVSKTVLRALAEQTRDQLMLDPQLSHVELKQEPDHEVEISVDQEQLQRYGLTVADIASAINRQAFDKTSGKVQTSGGDISVRLYGRLESAAAFENIPVLSLPNGGSVKVKDIATVANEFDDTGMAARYNGKPASTLVIYRSGQQTPVGISDTVKGLLPEIQAGLPPGVSLDITDDDSEKYRSQMDLLLENAFLGLILVLILLSLFLEYRLAFWVAMGIPTSILGAMILLPGMGVSINLISMFAFIIAVGVVVDDAVIAGESIYKHMQEGMDFTEAAILGAKEVAGPLTFSILTNMVAFLPVLALPGSFGQMMYGVPLVIITVFGISLLESLFILRSPGAPE